MGQHTRNWLGVDESNIIVRDKSIINSPVAGRDHVGRILKSDRSENCSNGNKPYDQVAYGKDHVVLGCDCYKRAARNRQDNERAREPSFRTKVRDDTQ